VRFAFTGVDRNLSLLDALLTGGWTLVELFTASSAPGQPGSNRAIVDRAAALGAPVRLSMLRDADLQRLGALGCQVLVCGSYNWRIGDWRPQLPYAVNFHPSPLPEGRGPYPLFRAILENRAMWGVACHKLEPAFDSGDILAAEAFPLSTAECHESLDLKTQMAFTRLAGRVARDFVALWDRATPQGRGSYWKLASDDDRTLDFASPVEHIMRRVRAFGLTETIAHVNGRTVYVRRAVGWTETHAHPQGSLVHADGRRSVVAALDGYIALIEWSPIPLAATDAVGRSAERPDVTRI
jgi:methionyl-tRNA formyltransferase